MFYYIDGYNLLFRILKGGENLRQEREQLIQDLESKINLLELDAIIVFDSQYQPDEGSSSDFKRLRVIFTAGGETADEYILKKLKETLFPNQFTVVTSDKRLAAQCRRRLACVEEVGEFMQLLNRRYKNKLKMPEKAHKQESPPAPTAPKKTVSKPLKKSSAEECRDYYLDVFQKEFEQQFEKAPPPQASHDKKMKKIRQQPLSKEEQELSDNERWQKIFEQRLGDGEV
jgi:predicted RNA-binding protein with PIN domain